MPARSAALVLLAACHADPEPARRATLDDLPFAPAWGHYAAGVGDVDGDGFDDVALIAGEATHDGTVRVHRGSPQGLEPAPAWTLHPDAWLYTVNLEGRDVDGDGRSELLLASGGMLLKKRGGAQVWRIGDDGPELVAEVGQGEPSTWLGEAAAFVDDLDGDGAPDLVLGAPRWADGAGAVQAFRGPAFTTPLATITGDPGTGLGEYVAPVGDLDGDGRPDLVTDEHRADGWHLVALSGATLARLPHDRVFPVPIARLGLVGLGDVDGDGLDDVAVALDGPPLDAQVLVVPVGPAAFGAPTALALSGPVGDDLGDTGVPGCEVDCGPSPRPSHVATAGDLTGDDVPDLAVAHVGRNGHGDVAVWAGGRLDADPVLTLHGEGDAWFGDVVGPAGDVDGDGHGDLLIVELATPGRLHVRYGPL